MLTTLAPPLVLLPGTLCDERVFGAMTAGLDHPAITVPMAGASSAPEMARGVLDAAPPRFALCGFSLGAIIALEVIAQAPERVERLALFGCNARAMPPERATARRATVQVAEREGTASFIAGVWDASVPAGRRQDADLRRSLEAMATDTPLDAFREQIEMAIDRVDSRPRLWRIGVPTLVACGEEDRVCPPELSREIAMAIPGATLAIVERAGHYLMLDQPDTVARLVRDWLDTPISKESRVSQEVT